MAYKSRRNNYIGAVKGNWLCIDVRDAEKSYFKCIVRCTTCGAEFEVSLSKFTHRKTSGCTCNRIEATRAHRIQQDLRSGKKRTDLELIWPSVVEAGRKVMRKYKHAMAKV